MKFTTDSQINTIDTLIRLGAPYPNDDAYENYNQAEKFISQWGYLKNKLKSKPVKESKR